MLKTGKLKSALALFLVAAVSLAFTLTVPAENVSAATVTKPAQVTGLKATYKGHYDYTVKWSKAKRATQYQVYRSTSKNGTYTKVKTLTGTSYAVYAPPGKNYYFKVRGSKKITQYYNSTTKKWVNSKPAAKNWKGKKTRKKDIYGLFSSKLHVCKEAKATAVASGVPAYWNEEINNSLESYRSHSTSDVGFVYFTDAHWGPKTRSKATNAQHSPAIMQYLYDTLGLKMCVFGGDMIAGTHKQDVSSALNEMQDFVEKMGFHSSKKRPDPVTQEDNLYNVMFTSGNHDFNTSSSGSEAAIPEDAIYRILHEEQTNHFETAAQNGRCSYADDSAHKIRYIQIYFDAYLNNSNPASAGTNFDLSYPSDEELNWLKETVQDPSLDEDWAIVFFTHAYWSFGKKATCPTEVELRTESGERLGNYLLKLEADENTKADIALWMTGHTHRDLDRVISSDTDSIVITCTNCDTFNDGSASRKSGYWGGCTMVKGHDTEQVLELVQIDKTNRKIYLTRVGAGKDREFNY